MQIKFKDLPLREAVKRYIEQFDKILNLSGICWWIIDYEKDPKHFYCNELMTETFSLDKKLLKHSIADTCPIAGDYNKNIAIAENSKEKATLVFEEFFKLLNNKIEEYNNQFPYFNKEQNKTFHFSSRAKVLETNTEGKTSILYGIIEDITIQESRKQELQNLSQRDKLTGLYNRLKLDESLHVELERSQRYSNTLSLIIIDLDNFKSINDTYGHLQGDKALVKSTDILNSNIRKTDILGRWGGEEFMLICPNTNKNSAGILAEKLRICLERYPFEKIGTQTASFGVTEFKKDETLESFIYRADEALFEAKRNGRNRVEIL